ncbi:MAG: RNA polymerase sigma factor [Patescibacteria group bacterium]|jgi:RNA polymerase sigma-70 factor (ECF subfamily)
MLQEGEIQKLVARAQSGRSDSISGIYEVFKDRIYRFFLFRSENRETAEDLTQSVFLEMIRSLPRYKEQSNAKFSTWLFQIARFRLIDYYRKARKKVNLDDLEGERHPSLTTEPEEVAIDTRYEAARKILKELPEKYQTVIHLTIIEEFSLAETAKIMSITIINVRVLKFRALKKIRLIMEQDEK